MTSTSAVGLRFERGTSAFRVEFARGGAGTLAQLERAPSFETAGKSGTREDCEGPPREALRAANRELRTVVTEGGCQAC